jgi:hypothetical protein
MNQKFPKQPHTGNTSIFSVEKEPRNDRESFNMVRMLSPTQYRFRVVDADGQDISSRDFADAYNTVNSDERDVKLRSKAELQSISKPIHPFVSSHIHSTRVECTGRKLVTFDLGLARPHSCAG